MREKKFEAAFIPCGDSMEKMEAINDDILESVSGGTGSAANCCPRCGGRMVNAFNAETGVLNRLVCLKCEKLG